MDFIKSLRVSSGEDVQEHDKKMRLKLQERNYPPEPQSYPITAFSAFNLLARGAEKHAAAELNRSLNESGLHKDTSTSVARRDSEVPHLGNPMDMPIWKRLMTSQSFRDTIRTQLLRNAFPEKHKRERSKIPQTDVDRMRLWFDKMKTHRRRKRFAELRSAFTTALNCNKIDLTSEGVAGGGCERLQLNYWRTAKMKAYAVSSNQAWHIALHSSPVIRALIVKYWDGLPKIEKKEEQRISKKTYIEFNMLLEGVLYGLHAVSATKTMLDISEQDYILFMRTLEADWKRDNKSHKTMNETFFTEFVLGVLDVWCETIDPHEYADLLVTLMPYIFDTNDTLKVINPQPDHTESAAEKAAAASGIMESEVESLMTVEERRFLNNKTITNRAATPIHIYDTLLAAGAPPATPNKPSLRAATSFSTHSKANSNINKKPKMYRPPSALSSLRRAPPSPTHSTGRPNSALASFNDSADAPPMYAAEANTTNSSVHFNTSYNHNYLSSSNHTIEQEDIRVCSTPTSNNHNSPPPENKLGSCSNLAVTCNYIDKVVSQLERVTTADVRNALIVAAKENKLLTAAISPHSRVVPLGLYNKQRYGNNPKLEDFTLEKVVMERMTQKLNTGDKVSDESAFLGYLHDDTIEPRHLRRMIETKPEIFDDFTHALTSLEFHGENAPVLSQFEEQNKQTPVARRIESQPMFTLSPEPQMSDRAQDLIKDNIRIVTSSKMKKEEKEKSIIAVSQGASPARLRTAGSPTKRPTTAPMRSKRVGKAGHWGADVKKMRDDGYIFGGFSGRSKLPHAFNTINTNNSPLLQAEPEGKGKTVDTFTRLATRPRSAPPKSPDFETLKRAQAKLGSRPRLSLTVKV